MRKIVPTVIGATALAVAVAIPATAGSTHGYNNRRIVCVQTSRGITEYFAHEEVQAGSRYAFLKVTKVRVFHSWPNAPHHIGQCI